MSERRNGEKDGKRFGGPQGQEIDKKIMYSYFWNTRMEAEYQNKSCSKTIKYNYIDKDNHLAVKVNLCMKSISYLREQLLHGTMIILSLNLVLPEWYQTSLSLSTVADFFGYCNCCTKHEPVFSTKFLSFKGQIEIFTTSEKGVYNTLFHITNTERLRLNTFLSSLDRKS